MEGAHDLGGTLRIRSRLSGIGSQSHPWNKQTAYHSMVRANLNKSKKVLTSSTTASKYILKRPRICINWNPPFQTQIYLVKVPLNVNIVKQDLLNKKQFLKILWSEVWKGGFQLMQILGLLGMYFDAVVVEVEKYLLLFRLALAILCRVARKVIVRSIWLGESLMGIIMRKLGKCTWLTWLSKEFVK